MRGVPAIAPTAEPALGRLSFGDFGVARMAGELAIAFVAEHSSGVRWQSTAPSPMRS